MLETVFEIDGGEVAVIDCMPPRDRHLDVVRVVEGRGRSVADAHRADRPVRLRALVPWVRRIDDALVAIGGPDRLRLTTPVDLRGDDRRTVGEFTVEAGERVPFELTWHPSHEGATTPAARSPRSTAPHGGGTGGLDVHIRRAVGRGRAPVAGRPQGPHLRPNGRPRRRADDVAAGAARRRTELGLPVLLAARRHVHPERADRRRLHRRGRGVAGLAAAGGGGRPGGPPDHVRRRRRASAPGARGRLAARLRGLATGAGRQRCVRAVPARRVRRGARLSPPSAGAGIESSEDAWTLQVCWSSSSRATGTGPTRGSGRSGASAATSRTRR